MNELHPDQFSPARPLFAGTEHFVIPQAVLAGHNPGRLFVDNAAQPTTAFLWTPCGFFFLAGDSQNEAFQRDLHHLLINELIPPMQDRGENGFILIPPDSSWATGRDVILEGRQPIEIYRRIFSFDAARFAANRTNLRSIPNGFNIQKLNSSLIAQFPELAGEIAATWGTVEAFNAHGRGFCILKDGELVSACLSVFASETADEISIHTAEAYRRQGWGEAVAATFIEDCLASGRHPNWECWWENEPSVRLAEKLGYTMLRDCPVYFWEERN